MYSSGISELVLVVKDVRSSARFYEEVVGLTPEKEADDEWAWFWGGTPGEAQRIALRKGPLLFEQHSARPEGERPEVLENIRNVPLPKSDPLSGEKGLLLQHWSG